MRRISLVAASFLALGWGAAKAETVSDAPPSTAGPTVSTPNTRVTTPPGSTATVRTVPDTTATDASDPALPGDEPATTNVEITTPPPVVKNTVVEPAPVPVQPLPATGYENRYVEQQYGPRAYVAPRVGTAMMVGGGVQDFTGTAIRDMTSTGGYWDARLAFGTRQFVGFEAAYVGSARDISALGLSNNAMLISNGVEGALRLNIPLIRGASLVEPFGFVGAGWSRYHVARSNTNTSDVASNDDILEVPYGAGLALGYQGFLADARFTYRSTFYNDMLRTTGGRLDNWAVGGQLGFEF